MTTMARFRAAYAEHRAAEGRRAGEAEMLALPYPQSGPWTRQWQVRARSWERFLSRIVESRARETGRPLEILDLGAGNGWLCYRLSQRGHRPTAIDWRADAVDGLAAAAPYRGYLPVMFPRLGASFENLPLRDQRYDLVVFNAAIHYTVNLERTLAEAARVTRPGGRIVILDSPFYRSSTEGERMVAEKRAAMTRDLGGRATDLLSLPAIEFLTRERLATSSAGLGWERHRVWYPLWYEWRAVAARLRGARAPSRFDVWEARVR